MHIAIEGLDGVGKTTTAKAVADRLGFMFVEKPMHYLTDKEGMDNYMRIMEHINVSMPSDFTAMFYGTGNLYLSYMSESNNIVTDRHIASNYFWNYNGKNIKLFDYLAQTCNNPDITIILFARADVRRQRIIGRNPLDPDLTNKVFSDDTYDKLVEFVKRYNMKYYIVDNSDLTLNETIDSIIKILHKEKVLRIV